ncbi:hypothetical protein I7I50_04178 [Histoplasma capsulatum G186AR]|uniref:Uncharacterized protein n=1 Tax=Ajellomyces capsulatus TaxID=5037 RepID=A0A8H7YQ27_AJECA|nr:hypothetical protein I7I52_05086 [Histoplasma capsulatum]QSS75137.1 hypothetical protein I7I50_04178 [Histoplasma capsulatum G186AR]
MAMREKNNGFPLRGLFQWPVVTGDRQDRTSRSGANQVANQSKGLLCYISFESHLGFLPAGNDQCLMPRLSKSFNPLEQMFFVLQQHFFYPCQSSTPRHGLRLETILSAQALCKAR